jgi:hypothetical protein
MEAGSQPRPFCIRETGAGRRVSFLPPRRPGYQLFRNPWESVMPTEGNLRYVARRIDVYDDPRSRTLARPMPDE